MDIPYDKLSNILESLLKDRQPKIEPPQSNSYPLFLILDIIPDLVCFSLLNGKVDESIPDTIQKFKNLYLVNSNKWADRDLALVFCKSDINKINDEQCNRIMLDPYFCRKFIIDLKEDLKTELVSLPFIPIYVEGVLGYQRPISAQTFLMKHGVNATLSKHLVIPYSRNEDGIVQDCIQGVLGEPAYLTTIEKQVYSIKEDSKTEIRLKDLELSNFRAYRSSYKFDLNADLVILYGPNGFGKTSFFDALDFAFTGSVGRFEKRFPRDTARVLSTLKHLDAQIEDSFTRATICINGEDFLLERFMKDRTQAFLNNQNMDRAAILMKLIGLSEEPPDLRIDNFARLFRATHLFGQEFQSIASDFHSNSKLDDDTVSRMLALQDYVEAINKSKKVLDVLRKQSRELKERIDSAKESLKTKDVELKRMRNIDKTGKRIDSISTIVKKIASKVNEQFPEIPIKISDEYDPSVIRDWRGKLDVAINKINQQIKDVCELENRFPVFLNKIKALKQLEMTIKSKKEELGKLNAEFSDRKKNLMQQENRTKSLLSKEQELHLKRDNLLWVINKITEYNDFKKDLQVNEVDLKKYYSQLCDITSKMETLNTDSIDALKEIDAINLNIKNTEDAITRLSDIHKKKDEINILIKRQKDEQENLRKNDETIAKIKSDLVTQTKGLDDIAQQHEKQKKHVEYLQRDQAELETLLDNITRHISDKSCPVCGTSHQSKEDLIEKVKIRRASQPQEIKHALEKLEKLNTEVKVQKTKVASVEKAIRDIQGQKNSTRENLLAIENSIKLYEESIKQFGLSIYDEKVFSCIDMRKNELTVGIKNLRDELNKLKERDKKVKLEYQSFKESQLNITKEIKTIESRNQRDKEAIEKIKNEALIRKISIEMDPKMANEELIKVKKEIGELKDALKEQTDIVNKEQAKQSILKKKIDDITIGEKTINKEKEGIDIYIEETRGLYKRFKFTIETKSNEISACKRGLNEKLSQAKILKEEIVDLEITSDAAQTAAIVAKLQDEIKNIQDSLEKIEGEQNNFKKWTSTFNYANKDLLKIKSDTFEEYINQYGPLTSNIQRRLRSVYGFGSIKLIPEKSGIEVKVERKGQENITPTDYFSESQIQIVLLSLFLSAGLTQTWSSFAPVLLDDPVTHFDDLNAYAFLDFIRGNMIGKKRKSQFIISTCDERLFRLMKQKFNKAPFSTIFYTIESIGETGPKITCQRA